MSYRGGWRPHIESALCLDLRRLQAIGAVKPNHALAGSLSWPDGDGGELGSMGYAAKLGETDGTLTLGYATGKGDERQEITCRIELDTTPIHYGGRRWYFRCPYSHRRALKLYKWPRIDLFCHRDAIRPRPTYASQRVGSCNRIVAQRWAIRRKLDDAFSDLFGEPFKPNGMHWRTFERYLERDNELAERENAYLARWMLRLGLSIKDF